MKTYLSGALKRIIERFLSSPTSNLSKNHKLVNTDAMLEIENLLRKYYYTGWRKESNYSKDAFRNDLHAHLYGRLESDRKGIIPWLDSISHLQNKRILEIGCGTGSSTIALAEQGAIVTGIDIDEGGLAVARERSRIYNIKAEFMTLNATDIANSFRVGDFDYVIFFACLEHMTTTERITSLKRAYELLPTGGFLVVIETPNRLWYFDNHTSLLPFFHWLPNDLAFQYSKFSPRENFSELYREYSASSEEHFLRRGRGISYHEFDLAIGPVQHLKIVSSLSEFYGKTSQADKLNHQYKSLLMRIHPNIHEGFFNNSLDIIIEKV